MSTSTEFLRTNTAFIMFSLALANQFDVPLPFEILLIGLGAMVAQHIIDPGLAIAAPVLGAILGNLILYATGRRWGPSLLSFLSRVTLDLPPRGDKIERRIDRWGAQYLLISNFLPLSMMAVALCGLRNLPKSRVISYSTVGIVVWVATYEALGYVGGSQMASTLGVAGPFTDVIMKIVAVAAVGWLVAKLIWHFKVLRQMRRAVVSPEILKARLEAGERLMIVDVRSHAHISEHPFCISGAIVIPEPEIEERRHDLPADQDWIVYGSTWTEVARARVALRLGKKHLERIYFLEGGIEAWRSLGHPVKHIEPATLIRTAEDPQTVQTATNGNAGAP